MTGQQLVNYASAGFAFCAAGLWFWASRAEAESDYTGAIQPGAKHINFHGGYGPILVKSSGKRVDLNATAALQGRLNSYAAAAAGVAAILQGIALALPSA